MHANNIILLEEAEKNLLNATFFSSVPPITNATEELCLFLRLAVCLSEASAVIGFTLVSCIPNC